MDGIKSIGRNTGYLSAARICGQLARVIYIILLARILGPELYGLYAFGQSWYMAFFPLTAFGLAAIIGREIGRDRQCGNAVVANTLTIQLSTSAAGAIVCALAGWFSEADAVARQLLLIFSLALAGRGVATWAEKVFVGYEESRFALKQEALFRPLEVVVGLAVLFSGGGVVGIVLVHAMIWWLQAIRGLWLVNRQLVHVRFGHRWHDLSTIVVQGLPICISAVLGNWLLQGPLVLFRHTGAPHAALGQLALAIQALVILSTVPTSLSLSALPVLSRAVDRGDGKDRMFVEGVARLGILFGAVAGLSGMALGPWFVELVFGAKFAVAGHLLGPALWLLAPLTVAVAAGQTLVARGLYRTSALCNFIAALAFTASLPTLIDMFGALGALLAAGIGRVVQVMASLLAISASGRIDWTVAVVRPSLVAAAALCCYLLSVGNHVSLRLLLALTIIALGGWFVALLGPERLILMHRRAKV